MLVGAVPVAEPMQLQGPRGTIPAGNVKARLQAIWRGVEARMVPLVGDEAAADD